MLSPWSCDTHVSHPPSLRSGECEATGDKGVGCWKLPLPLPPAPAPTKDIIRPAGVPERVWVGCVVVKPTGDENQAVGGAGSWPTGSWGGAVAACLTGRQDAWQVHTSRVSRALKGFPGRQPRTRSPGWSQGLQAMGWSQAPGAWSWGGSRAGDRVWLWRGSLSPARKGSTRQHTDSLCPERSQCLGSGPGLQRQDPGPPTAPVAPRLWTCRALPPAGAVPGLERAARGCKVGEGERRRPGCDSRWWLCCVCTALPADQPLPGSARSVPTAETTGVLAGHPGARGHDTDSHLPLPAAQPPSQRSADICLEQWRAGPVTLKGATQLRNVPGSLLGGRQGLAAHLS